MSALIVLGQEVAITVLSMEASSRSSTARPSAEEGSNGAQWPRRQSGSTRDGSTLKSS